jgi:preprotein translocase subunit SecY
VPNLAGLLLASRDGILSQGQLAIMALLAVAFLVLAIMVERARRNVRTRFAERQVGDRRLQGPSVELAFKLNPGGIVPAMVATWILLIVVIVTQLAATALGQHGPGGWLASLAPGRPLHLAISFVVIILFSFVYTAFLHDPEQLARQLETHGGTVDDLAPGTTTADYLDATLSRVTALGAIYLAAIMLLPIMLAGWLGVPFAVGGIWLLVLVCMTLDVEAQVRALLSQPR